MGRLAGSLLLSLAILLCVAWVVPSALGYERYVITGGSMSGAFEKGSVAFAKPVPVHDLVVGDVITYLPPDDSGVDNLVTHRIVSTDVDDAGRTAYVTQGDANPDPDPWEFSLAQPTQPVVDGTVPWVGYGLLALADREVRMLVIGVPSVLIAMYSLVELARAVRPRPRSVAELWHEPGGDVAGP